VNLHEWRHIAAVENVWKQGEHFKAGDLAQVCVRVCVCACAEGKKRKKADKERGKHRFVVRAILSVSYTRFQLIKN
jgi:hypothetical protein